jgi:hypothetical protein
MQVHRLEACATGEKQDAGGAQVENLCHHEFSDSEPAS